MARKRSVPGLPALLRRRRRRRSRRPPGLGREARPPRLAGRRRDLAGPGHALPRGRVGLRRLGLPRRRPRRRHARGPGRARRRGARARDPRPPRPRPQPHERPPPVVPRRAQRPRVATSRLVHLGRARRGRLSAEQLALRLRRPRLDARRRQRRVLPAHLPAGAAGSHLAERGRARRLRRDPPLLVLARDRGLPHRRPALPREGRRAAPQPARRAGRPVVGAPPRPAARVELHAARVPRPPAPLASSRATRSPRSTAPATTSCT